MGKRVLLRNIDVGAGVGDAATMILPAALLEDVIGRAAATPGVEVCGLLFGGEGRIEAAAPAANVAADPATGFEIDPVALLAAHRAERAGGARIVGCYHSHPSGDATPSARDAAAAEPGRCWLIVAGGRARLWRAESGGFREVAFIAG